MKGKKPTAAQIRALQAAVCARDHRQAVNHARDLINEPAAVITPTALAEDAEEIAKRHKGTVSVTVLDAAQCADLGMGMFLAVGRGSEQEPRFIHMTYKPAEAEEARSASSARASPSTPAATRSSPRNRWRT